ncbi:hypothetical protein BKA70DRAFT_1406645 [Coprinopsis sp. MPI-PUGE-AT-0042]|nr:hypothetical protein BKA70DRAFT_1406645 [Coprinopsis sp. MPI-PUGE-AT-0042]
MSQIFLPGRELNVITRGPGTLQLLSFQPDGSLTANISTVRPTTQGLTNYIVAAAFTYQRFALVWTGQGEAVYQIGNSLVRQPVGRDWTAASTIILGSNAVVTDDVSAVAKPLLKPNMPLGGMIYAVGDNIKV